MPHFMIVLITCINLMKPFLENKMSIFEEYGDFNGNLTLYTFEKMSHLYTMNYSLIGVPQ